MAVLNLTKNTTVEALRKEFNDAFGAQIKLYNGHKKAEMSDTLGSLGLTTEGEFECRSSITVASFTDRMAQNHGLKVKVYTCDEWVAVLDGLTLESAGKVKKNAVKADMESMIAYQRTDSDTETPVAQVKKSASCGDYTIDILADNKVIAKKGGVVCDNAKGTMREIADQVGFAVDANWTTQQLGSKLVDFLENGAKPVVDTAKIEAEKAAAQKAKAEAEKTKAEAAAAKPAATGANKGALPGLFSVGENKKVRFSMGNLQFNPKKYEFRFALHQYDNIGNDNRIDPNYDGWIDLFGYGTSGYMGCQPYESSNIAKQYPQQNIAGTNYDWGVYNPISNGGNKEGLWRTLTKDEWQFLLFGRPNASKMFILATVNGIIGRIILPDNFYEKRIRVPVDATPDDYRSNSYGIDDWKILEDAGVVFLPCIKRRGITGIDVYYWSSSFFHCSTSFYTYDYAYMTGPNKVFPDWPSYGLSVRLVQDVK